MDYKELSKKLTLNRKNVWEKNDFKTVDDYTENYKKFMDYSKTERKAIKYSKKLLEENGYKPLEFFEKEGKLKDGDKVYYINRDKSLFAIEIKGKIKNGVNIVGSHVDAPRIDFKPEPLIEDTEIAMAKTHYYGGIKKYQWLNIPLELHGVIINSKGETVEVSIGDDLKDPVFVISDLLPHLDRNKKAISEAIDPEKMNLLLGTISINYDSEEKIKDSVKLNILNILNEKYGIIEEDLISAELEIVPSLPSRDVGLDRSLIAAYGHDDRICAYTSLTALINSKINSRSSAILLVDKEEIGSDGNTGAKNHFWIPMLKKLLKLQNEDVTIAIEDAINNSILLSSDVSAAFDPNYKDAHDINNAPKLNYGIVLTKYTGARGKAGTNDANAEVVGKVRKVWNENNILWQTGELGRTDLGGGGTIAKFFAEQGLDVIDAGVALLGMHAPYEIASKGDLYETYLAYKVFMENYK
ncbi:aminopeptidase [Oceanotoga sp. DSM 15011]|uniref:aminopeptidase n=1 Tax=Oceanotoga sp. DSM 15011 TaxID=2984951 RepID=UPI0021F47E18|nr:aminopeptidase [Oceanotoga sp. DSM 15011]UYP00648.1 aminopeptidase [Oceanotoga sp. DSM 15011]